MRPSADLPLPGIGAGRRPSVLVKATSSCVYVCELFHTRICLECLVAMMIADPIRTVRKGAWPRGPYQSGPGGYFGQAGFSVDRCSSVNDRNATLCEAR